MVVNLVVQVPCARPRRVRGAARGPRCAPDASALARAKAPRSVTSAEQLDQSLRMKHRKGEIALWVPVFGEFVGPLTNRLAREAPSPCRRPS